MMKLYPQKKNFLKGIAICTISAFLLTGCGGASQTNAQTALADTGYMVLSVNPEIRIEYNKNGLVTNLQGKNEDGKQIVANYTDYIGKDCDRVVSDLIKEIHTAGYFVDDIDGNGKNIVIQIEPGSVVPDNDFINEISQSAQDTVKDLKTTSNVVAIDEDDYDEKYNKNNKPSQYITLAKAQEIALKQAGIAEQEARFDDKEFDLDDGTPIYELEFSANGVEYEYDIHAVSGKILKAEQDLDDDRDDDDRAAVNNTQNTKQISLEDAVAIALKHAKVNAADARFDDKEFDNDDGTPIYELEFSANGVEYEYDIHAVSGKILNAERDFDDDRDDDDRAAVNNTQNTKQISLEDAVAIALKHAKVNAADARFDDKEFDNDDGIPMYELEFYANGVEYEYDIHAVSGKILKAEQDHDDDDNDWDD